MPDRLVTFDPRHWPPGPTDPDPDDVADPALAAAWDRTLRRRLWRRARIDWLAAHGQPTLPEFIGWRSHEDADFLATVAAVRAAAGEIDGVNGEE